MKKTTLQVALAALLCASVQAQVNSGSDGHDGAFNPTTNTVINMADHPDGIYHYTSVFIPTNVTVTFIPNAANTPVVWLVQSNCVINGTVNVSGQNGSGTTGGAGGPGGYRGGNGGTTPTYGQGPGGGALSIVFILGYRAGSGSYGELGSSGGPTYGNSLIMPLLGGSGGGGHRAGDGGGGGGGAILIAASAIVQLNGTITAPGGTGVYDGYYGGGAGSGGAIRLVATTIAGTGSIATAGGNNGGGRGRIRLDALVLNFGGTLDGVHSQGFQPVILPVVGEGVQLAIASVGGIAVSANPSGLVVTPDAIVSGQQANPISIVVQCSSLPLNTPITVTVKPIIGTPVSAVGYNTTGTLASSTATVSLNMPRGGGIIYATAVAGN